MRLPDKLYDVFKWLSCIVFNAIGLLYARLASTWGLPYGDQVQATCAAIAFFLGALIGISTAEYNAEKRKEMKQLEKEPFKWDDPEIDE